MSRRASEPVVAGVDLGGTNMQIGIVDQRGRIIARQRDKTRADEGSEAVIGRIVEKVESACRDAEMSLGDLAAIGIAAPGAIDMPNGIVLDAPNLGWENIALRDTLRERLGCSVVVDNDVNGAVWGEYMLGAGRSHDDLLGVWIGTGVGGGLVIGGRLHHGALHTAGEIGQTIILPHGEPSRRTVEDLCSRTGMSRIIRDELLRYPDAMLRQSDTEPYVRTKQLAEAYRADDKLAVKVIDTAASLLGIAIANWVTVLACDRVVIGGGVTEALGEPFLARIRASFERDVFPARSRACELVMTALEADAGLLGAAMLAHDSVHAAAG